MRFHRLGLVCVIGASLALTACGYSCENLCEDMADCSGSEQNPDDCDPQCEILERVNEDSECEDEYDELLSCASELEDICDEDDQEKCSDELTDYSDCRVDFCDDHPSNDDC